MSSFDDERATNEGMPEAPEPESVPEPASWSLTQEEWASTQNNIKQIHDFIQSVQNQPQYEEPQYEENLEDADLATLTQRYVDARLAEIAPYVTAGAEDAGSRQEEQMFNEIQSEIGDFDHELAHRIAQSVYMETGDAETAVHEGAKMAQKFAESQATKAVEAYKASIKKPREGEPGVSSGATFAEKKPKTYQEVADYYANTYSAQNEL